MKVTDLLHFRVRSLRRRLSGGIGLTAALMGLTLAILLVVLGGPVLAEGDTGELAIRDGAFWFSTLLTLLYSYTTFEVIFRAADQKAVAAIPIPPGTRYWDLWLRAVALHLPLLLLPLSYAYGLAHHDQPVGALFAATYGTAMFVFGLPLAITTHLWAGQSLLTQGTQLRKVLAGAAVQSDAAVLVYAPALALMVNLVLGIFLDLLLRDAILRQKSQMLLPLLGGVLVIATLAVRMGHRIAVSSLLQVLPRFSEVDVAPPYREDGIRRQVPGERFANLIPATATPYFLRDIRQLRRRYRLDRILLVLFGAYCLKLVHDAPATAEVGMSVLTALLVMNGALIVSAFRLSGELAAPAFERGLPIDPPMSRLGRLLSCAIHPVYALGLATLAVASRGDLGGALKVLSLGLGVTVLTVVVPVLIAQRGDPRGAAWAASIWRLAVLTGAIVVSGVS